MLVDEHPDRYPRHVEPIQEILYAVLGVVVHVVGILQLEDALRHRLDDVRMPVPDPDQRVAEQLHRPRADVALLELDDLLEAPDVPVVDGEHRGHPEQVLGEERDLFHYVGQSDGQLLAEEYEGLLLGGVQAWNNRGAVRKMREKWK